MASILTQDSYRIRPFHDGDGAALYEVCLKTGNGGQDASHLYDDPDILGHIYVGPYLLIAPEFAFVLEDRQGICGYILGALDSPSFYQAYLERWLPRVRDRYAEPTGNPENWTPTQELVIELFNPPTQWPEAMHEYPSHLHIDLVERAQGRGQGTAMMNVLLDHLRQAGSKGVHLGMAPENYRAERFYRKMGFTELARGDRSGKLTLYLGRHLIR